MTKLKAPLVKFASYFTIIWFLPSGFLRGADPSPPGAFSRTDLRLYFEIRQKLHPEESDSFNKLLEKYGDRPFYTPEQVRNLLEALEPPPSRENVGNYMPPTELRRPPLKGWAVVSNGLIHPKIRQNYSDIIYSEDPSQPTKKSATFDDLSGATLSYTYDGKAHTKTWAAEGALIAPMLWSGPLESGWRPITYGLVPSISLHRVTSDGSSENEVDSLIYRAGLYGRWLLINNPQNFHAALNVRGSFTYATDTEHGLAIPAGELDLEPQLFVNPHLSLGYVGELFYNQQATPDDPKRVHLAYQLRAWLHAEGGTVEHPGNGLSPPEESFVRLGPVVQLRILFPSLYKGVTLSTEYHYLPALSGWSQHQTLFKASAEVALYKSKIEHRQLSLKASYVNGGLDLTKQAIETFLIGVGITY